MNVRNDCLLKEAGMIGRFQVCPAQRNAIFSLLMQPYLPVLYARCQHKIKEKESVDDVMQEILLRIYLALPDYKHEGVFKVWIYTITDNTCYSYLRKHSKYKHNNVFMESLDTFSPDTPTNIDDEIDISAFIEELAYKEQEIIILRFFQDLTLLEISDILSITISACKMRLYRALKLLNDMFYRQQLA